MGRARAAQALCTDFRFAPQAWSGRRTHRPGPESLRWNGLFGRFGDKEKDWWAGLAEVEVPLLAVAGAGDFQDPVWACRKLFEQFGGDARQFLRLGREEGFEAFGHVDMLVSKAAQTQVWPLVERWLRDPWYRCMPRRW